MNSNNKNSNNKNLSIETLCVHAGVEPEPITGAIMTPIFQTSTYVQSAPGVHKGYDYSRGGNPTRSALEKALAALEGASEAISFASGLAGVQALVQTLDPGAHVLVCDDVYGGTGRLFRKMFAKYNIEFEFLDMRDSKIIAGKFKSNTKMVWIESPTNPLLHLVDIAAVAEMAHKAGAIVVVDNTFASPIFQSPLKLGAHAVLHSSTKYLGGHSDLIGGVVQTSHQELAEQLRFIQFAGGAVNAPQECFLLLRSLKTLAIRMERHHNNSMKISEALQSVSLFSEVLFPGLKSHPQHELAKRQMSGFAGMVSARINGDLAKVTKFVQRLEIFALAESLGGVESLVNHPETMTHASVPPDHRKKLGITSDLVRFSVGIENVDDLIADIKQAAKGL
jgi:cystathionine beta-lyase/cystathionine gamma-synthase